MQESVRVEEEGEGVEAVEEFESGTGENGKITS